MSGSSGLNVDQNPGIAPSAKGDAAAVVVQIGNTQGRHISRSNRAWYEFRRNRLALAGTLFMLFVTAMAILAPVVATHDPNVQVLSERLDPPSADHIFGTDELGRDFYSRLVYGARISLFIGFVGTAVGVFFGTLIGLVSGFFGGWTDTLVMRVIDIMYAFPGILLAILVVAVVGPGILNLIIVLAIFSIPSLSRIVRGNVLALMSENYVEAARAIGASRWRIMFVHVLPNTLAPIIVYTTLAVAGAILTSAALGFLGLGVQPPTPEWGSILSNGRVYLRRAPLLMIYPGALIFLTVISINLIGDALRDALDPYIQSTTNR
jgi:peptide/nickel transport system permease protein